MTNDWQHRQRISFILCLHPFVTLDLAVRVETTQDGARCLRPASVAPRFTINPFHPLDPAKTSPPHLGTLSEQLAMSRRDNVRSSRFGAENSQFLVGC